MTDVTTDVKTPSMLREGDIYRWHYREPSDDRQYGRYHCCCSCIAIVRAGRLRDTYWQIGDSFVNGQSFGEDDLPKLELTFLGNMADLEKASEHQADYYDDADIVNLNHSNSNRDNFYLRKGAVRSKQKMLAAACHKLEQALSDVKMATQRVERFRDAIARIESGDTTGYF